MTPHRPHSCTQTRAGTYIHVSIGREARGDAPATPSVDPEPECSPVTARGDAGQRELSRASALAEATSAVVAGGR